MFRILTISALILFHLSLAAQDNRTSTLASVLTKIERLHGVKFAYDYQLASSRQVSVPDYSQPLLDLLESTLNSNGFSYEMGSRVILIAPKHNSPTISEKPGLSLSGFIRDGATGESLANAVLVVNSTGHFAVTNAKGYFSLKDIPADTSKIEINYLGYQKKLLKTSDFRNGFANVRLVANPEVLDAVLVEDEVESFDISPQIGKIDISSAKMQMLSSMGQPDIIRSIQLLPGVVSTGESSSGLSVRGGGTDQNLVLFDGFSVFSIDHFFGTLSAFNSNVVRDISLYKGGFSTKYGGRVSSVLDIESRDGGTSKRPRGSVGVDLMSVTGMVESSVNDKVSVMVAGRRSYTDLFETNVFQSVVNNVKDNRPNEVSNFVNDRFVKQIDPDFSYYDINAKVRAKLSDVEELRFSLYNSRDRLDVADKKFIVDEVNNVTFDQEYEESSEWGNTGLSLNYSRQWSPLLTSQFILANSSFYRNHEVDFFLDYKGEGFRNYHDITTRDKNYVRESSFRVDNQYQITRNASLEFGLFATNNRIEYHNLLDQNLQDLNIQENGNQFGIYAQQTYKPLPNFTISGGLRGTYYSGTDNNYLEPRLSLNYAPYPSINIKGAVGRYYQFIGQATTNNPFLTQESFWLLSDAVNVAAIASNHYVGGVTFNHDIITIDVEGYYKTLDGLTAYAIDSSGLQNFNLSEQFGALYRGSGRVRGMDVLIKRDFGNLNSLLSYSLSSVRHKFFNLNEGREFDANQDQRHELKWVNTLRAGKWEFSSTFVYGSGRPYTGFPFEVGQQVQGEEIVNQLFRGGSETNNLRIPAYHRLDLGMSYTMNFGKYTDGEVGVNLFNIYNRSNTREIRYDVDFNRNNQTLIYTENRIRLLEFTPSLYLNFYF